MNRVGYGAVQLAGPNVWGLPADPESARDNYSRSKASAELLALGASTRAFSVVAVRPHLVWGPGRHIIGHNVAAYHRNADQVRVELFCEMDQIKDEALGYFDPRPWHQDRPQVPKTWPKDTLRNYWGFGSHGTFPGYP